MSATIETPDPTPPEETPEEVIDDTDPMGEEEEQPESDRGSNVRRLLPVHAAPTLGGKGKQGNALKVERQRGRPRKVERMPTTSDLQYHDQMAQEKERYIASDPVVIATTKGKAEATVLLKLIRAEIAKEAAALQFQRMENEKYGKDTAQTSTRRIDALTKIANIELEIKKLGPSEIDPYSEGMQKILALWVDAVREICTEMFSPEQIDFFFNRLSTQLEGWEERIANGVK